MKRVFIPFPTPWDRRHLEPALGGFRARYAVDFGAPDDADCPAGLDVLAWVEDTARRLEGRLDGVFSSSDYPGAAAAAALCRRLGLRGADPAAVVGAAHKLRAREVGLRVVPEATPSFAAVDPDAPAAPFYPCFLKPVKGAFSLLTARMETPEDLGAFFRRPAVESFRRDYVRIFDQLAATFTDIREGAGTFLAEGLLSGRQATLEAFVHRGEVRVLGITDSITDPVTGSFLRFDYPSALPQPIQHHMTDVAARLARALGLDDTLFNVEFFVDGERVMVIELNPRMCGQFADLYEKVDGVHGYAVAMSLACGETPPLARGRGAWGHSASFPLRTFDPVRVARVPDAADLRRAQALRPGTQVWVECAAGEELRAGIGAEDGHSRRYGVVNLAGRDLADTLAMFEEVRAALDFRFSPLPG